MSTQITLAQSAIRAPSIAQLKAKAAGLRVEVTVEVGPGPHYEIQLTAPAGHRFEEGLHQLIHHRQADWDGDGHRACARTCASKDLDDYPIEKCDTPDCEWCHPDDEEPTN